MVGRSKRQSGKRAVMGNHQRCWIWGRQAVLETLRAGRWPILELHLSDALPAVDLDRARRLAEKLDIAIQIESPTTLARICRADDHQGYLTKMPPFPYEDADALLKCRPQQPFYLLLDQIHDPFNFGAMLRSADALAVDAVYVSTAGQCEVTSLVARASAGAVNFVRLARVPDLGNWIQTLRQAGIVVVGTASNAKEDVSQHDFRGSAAIVLGNEGAGVRSEILDICDARVGIRQRGHVGSLNAAVAAGIFLYEVSRQRMGNEPSETTLRGRAPRRKVGNGRFPNA